MTSETVTPAIKRPADPDPAYLPNKSLRKRLSRYLRRLRVNASDVLAGKGEPPRTHVVICGFPRSGTTLLQLIVESCAEDVHFFSREERGLFVAQFVRTNEPFLVSKFPVDVFCVDEIRKWYASRTTDVRFILSLRDPRDVLTSFHSRRPKGEYFLAIERWPAIYEHFCYARQFPDTLVVRYEDLVSDPQQIAGQIQEFVGWRWSRPIESFYEAVPDKFVMDPLNGLRPMDRTRTGRWKAPEHRERIRQILRKIPEMPQYLIDEGYESDKSWTAEYDLDG